MIVILYKYWGHTVRFIWG